jgi:Protein of unknown function (DUF3723)
MAASSYFLGYGRVDLHNLSFDSVVGKHRSESEKLIVQLVNVFRCPEIGCQHGEEVHAVPAVVDTSLLRQSLRGQELPKKVGPDSIVPKVSIGEHLQCLHGLHRIAAGKRVLDSNDSNDFWWTVAFYSAGKRWI